MKKSIDFPEILSEYLTKYLPLRQGASVNTIKSYRDGFKIFLRYCRDTTGIRTENFRMKHFTRKLVNDYLLWLEESEGCGISTANHRLSTIQAFMKFIAVEYPEFLDVCTVILTIKAKSAPERAMDYLHIDELKVIFAQPSAKAKDGLRDIAILALLYDSGARVQELIDICAGDIRVLKPATVTLTGKGDKTRIVPIVEDTARILKNYLSSQDPKTPQEPLFTNLGGHKLSRSGIEYIISKYVDMAVADVKALAHRKITPHTFRHSKAMHLVQAGVNIIYIRDILGHVSVQTTERYAKADSKAKREALEAASRNILPKSKYRKSQKQDLIDWLEHIV